MKQQQILDLESKIRPRIRRCLLFLAGPGLGLQVVAEAQALLHDLQNLVWAERMDSLAELQASGLDPGQHLLLEFGERSIEILLADPRPALRLSRRPASCGTEAEVPLRLKPALMARDGDGTIAPELGSWL